MKHSIKKLLPLLGLEKIEENGFNLVSSIVSTRWKKLSVNAQSLQLIKIPFPLARIKDSLKKSIPLDEKATSILVSIGKKIEENSFL